jgi:hypothetical protein
MTGGIENGKNKKLKKNLKARGNEDGCVWIKLNFYFTMLI